MTRSEVIRKVMEGDTIEVSLVCPTPYCGESTIRIDDFYPPSPLPGECDAFEPISGVCSSCGSRVYFANPIPWSKVTLFENPSSDSFSPNPPRRKDDEPDIPE